MIIKTDSFRYVLKKFGLWLAIKSWCTGVDFDTGYPRRFWTIKKGEQFDYKVSYLTRTTMPIKPEGAQIAYDLDLISEDKLGDWKSWLFRTRWFEVYYRRRSWTKDIFYIKRN